RPLHAAAEPRPRLRRRVGIHVLLRHRSAPAPRVRRRPACDRASGRLAAWLLLSTARADGRPAVQGLDGGDPPRAGAGLPHRARVPAAALGAPPPGPRVDGAGAPHVIVLREVSKRFGAHQALDGVSLTVAPHTTHVLLGGSG